MTNRFTNTHNKTFLIIPSIFNSSEIFFLARDKSFIENLRNYGEVYLVDHTHQVKKSK
ncbi:MAG: hypothetical protein O7C62_06900 [Rickettsia endosymbiont of Ixodes persulcatus]|nr:hypothetical protein [Rickettsia endosymbiont of Ixodes persulcatus]